MRRVNDLDQVDTGNRQREKFAAADRAPTRELIVVDRCIATQGDGAGRIPTSG